MSQLFHLQSSNSYLFSMFHESEEYHIFLGLTSEMSISLTFSFYDISARMFEFTSE